MKRIIVLILFMETISLYGQDDSLKHPEPYMFGIEYLNNNKREPSFQEWVYNVGRLNRIQLRIIRNTIYAKHGYIFNSIDLQQYFSQFSWYSGTKTNVDNELTENDRILIDFIREIEANYSSVVQKELIGVWRHSIRDDWWTYRNPGNDFYNHHGINLRFWQNGIFNYTFRINNGIFYDYFGFWLLDENKLKLKFYFVGIDYKYYIFDSNTHHEYWTTNFEENIIFIYKKINEVTGDELWECNFQKNLPLWKRINSNPAFHPGDGR
jgi:hypothetical protein